MTSAGFRKQCWQRSLLLEAAVLNLWHHFVRTCLFSWVRRGWYWVEVFRGLLRNVSKFRFGVVYREEWTLAEKVDFTWNRPFKQSCLSALVLHLISHKYSFAFYTPQTFSCDDFSLNSCVCKELFADWFSRFDETHSWQIEFSHIIEATWVCKYHERAIAITWI